MNLNERFKQPDKKNALSLATAAKSDMELTLKIKPTEESATTIIRNIYESFRMLGDSILLSKGIESRNHLKPINELLLLKIPTKRPLRTIENLRQLRHNLNYYGYKPKISEVIDAIDIAKTLFDPIFTEIKKSIITR